MEAARGGACGRRCKTRYILAILGSIGMGIIYGLKVALHVAIVPMVNHTALSLQENKTVSEESSKDDGPFTWDSTVQGYLLSSYFWGYIVAQIPGGRVAELLSAKWVFFFAVAINVISCLLSPILATAHYGALLFLRILMGIGGGVTFPACHVLLAHWAPPSERSFMSSLIYAGTALGTVIFMLLSGLIAGFLGWEAVFYIEGGSSAVWLLAWAWLISDSPKKQKLISEEEREFILKSLGSETGASQNEHPRIPWKAVFTSKPFIAILVAHTCSNWGWYLLLIELPSYMHSILKFDIKNNALLSALPFFIMWIFSLGLSRLLDYLREKGKISTTTARKIATLIASVIPSICLLILCFVEGNKTLAVVMMTIAITSIGGMFSGFLSNHIDIAPNFAGTLVALTNTVATIPGIVVPIVTGKLTHNNDTMGPWRIIFYITLGLYAVEIVVYTLLGSGEVQNWNKIPDEPTEDQPLQPKTK